MKRGLLLVMFAVGSLLWGCPKGGPQGGSGLQSLHQYLVLQSVRNVPDNMKVKGHMRVLWPANGIRVRSGMRVMVQRPGHLKGELLGLAGQPVVQLAMNDASVEAYLRFLNAFVEGDNPELFFEEITDGMLSRELFLNLLVGRLPGFEDWEGEAIRETESGQVRMELEKDGTSVTVWVYEDRMDPVRLVGRVPGMEGVAFAIGYEDFRDVGRYRIPGSVTVEVPSIDFRLDLIYSDVEVEVAMTEKDFHIDAPDGVQRRSLDEMFKSMSGAKKKDRAKEANSGSRMMERSGLLP